MSAALRSQRASGLTRVLVGAEGGPLCPSGLQLLLAAHRRPREAAGCPRKVAVRIPQRSPIPAEAPCPFSVSSARLGGAPGGTRSRADQLQ